MGALAGLRLTRHRAMLGSFGWELGRCAALWLLGRRVDVTILLPGPRREQRMR